MNIQDLRLLFEFNYWATRKILTSAVKIDLEQFTAAAPCNFGSLRGTLVHILGAEWLWRQRCQNNTSPAALLSQEEFPSLESLRDRWNGEELSMVEYLNGLNDENLKSLVHYNRFGGEPRENVLWHLLIHVVNHGTEHRSEAGTLLTQYGASPGDIDFVYFLRSRN